MNLKRLEYFTTLAQTGNMQKAGEILRVSAPALSKAMKVLEDELEVKLWMRDGRNIILTDAGVTLFKKSPLLIEELKKLKSSLHKNENSKSILRIGTFEIFSTYFLKFLDRLDWNDCVLELHELLPGMIEKHIINNELDIGITYLPIPDPQLDFLKITSIEMGVFTCKGAFKDYQQKNLPYVVPVMPLQGNPNKVRGLDGWPEDAYTRKVLHQVTLMESALELCRQGRVAGYFPVFVVNEHNKRVKEAYHLERRRSPYSERVCRSDVYIVKRKSMEETQEIKKISKAIRIMCN